MISKSPNNDQPTKIIEAAITEVRTRYVTVEVPCDASDSDDNLLHQLSEITRDDCGEIDELQVAIEDSSDSPEYRMHMRNGKWHVTQLGYDTLERRDLAGLHAQIVRSQEDPGDLYFNRVAIEFPNERLAPGCIYYRADYALVVVVTEGEYCTGLLRGFDRCYPALVDAGPIPWELVDEIHECEQTGTWNLLDRAEKWFAELEPEKRAERPLMVPSATIVHPEPRRADDPYELYHRFQRSKYEADVIG